jgi:hypothetical protein
MVGMSMLEPFDAILRERITELAQAEQAERQLLADPIERLRLDAAQLVITLGGRPTPIGGFSAYLPSTDAGRADPTLNLLFPAPPPPPKPVETPAPPRRRKR